MRLYSEMHRFIPALAAGTTGARIKEIPVRHHARVRGKSKYGLSRVGRVVVDLLTVSMIRSIRRNSLTMFGSLGVLSAALGLPFIVLALRSYADVGAESGSPVVPIGVALVLLALSLFLVMLGLVAQVAISANARRRSARGAFLHEVMRT
jgi:hypothetical protein